MSRDVFAAFERHVYDVGDAMLLEEKFIVCWGAGADVEVGKDFCREGHDALEGVCRGAREWILNVCGPGT